MKPTYVPLLKWKQGELTALRETFPADRHHIIPLLEFIEDTLDEDDDPSAGPGQGPYGRLLVTDA